MNLYDELVLHIIIDWVSVFVANQFQDNTPFVKLILSFISGSVGSIKTTFLVDFVL